MVCHNIDEVKVKEDIVYEKHTGSIIGFIHPLDITSTTTIQETNPATHILTVMVRSICGTLELPIGHFPTRTCTAEGIYNIIWQAIHILEGIGYKIVAVVCDGAAPNRKFF